MERMTPEQYPYASTLPGPKQALTHHREWHIMLNDGS